MFQPKRTKYRKQFKGRNTGNAQRGATLSFGTFGLKAFKPKVPKLRVAPLCAFPVFLPLNCFLYFVLLG